MKRCLLLPLLALCLAMGLPATAQTPTPDPNAPPNQTYAFRPAALYAGPGDTYVILGRLNSNEPVTIIERNRIGNWLRVNRINKGKVAADGWVQVGYLKLDPRLKFSEVAVNTVLPDADVKQVKSAKLKQLYSAPVIPEISPIVGEIYQRGLKLGSDPRAVTKVGDSLSANPIYLQPMGGADNQLGPYDYLQDTLTHFGRAAAADSVAARIGLTTYVIFDPMWADKAQCQPGETPLDCEYRLKKPSVALIMFGSNDVKHIIPERYEAGMRQIVDVTLNKGIVPVIFTFSYHPDNEHWEQAVEFNLRLVKIAADYQIPLVNLWAAARPLPDYGLDIDNVHLKNSGFKYLKFSSGNETWYGVALQNLLALRVLDELRRTLDMKPG